MYRLIFMLISYWEFMVPILVTKVSVSFPGQEGIHISRAFAYITYIHTSTCWIRWISAASEMKMILVKYCLQYYGAGLACQYTCHPRVINIHRTIFGGKSILLIARLCIDMMLLLIVQFSAESPKYQRPPPRPPLVFHFAISKVLVCFVNKRSSVRAWLLLSLLLMMMRLICAESVHCSAQ